MTPLAMAAMYLAGTLAWVGLALLIAAVCGFNELERDG